MTCIIKPIFISGASRSGTTMLGSQLASHSDAFALPEMPFIWEMIQSKAKTEKEVQALYERITQDFHYRATGINVDFNTFAKPYLDEKPAAERVFHLLRHHVGLDDKKVVYWIEHTPHNRERIETYQSVFPEAKFIHLVRDPRAVYASMHKLPRWNSKDPVGFALRWNAAQTHGFLGVTKMGSEGTWVRYEDILLDPKTTLNKLSNFIGYDFQEELLTGSGIILPEYTKDQHQLVGQAVDPTRIYAWQKSIPTRDAELILWKSLPWMKHFNYCSIAEASNVKPLSKLEKLQYKIKQSIATPLKHLRRFLDGRALQ